MKKLQKIYFENISKIFNYLDDNNIYYAKDLFLLSIDEFVNRFEKLKSILGNDYADKLGDDASLIELMYKNN